MPEAFLHLPAREQSQIYRALAAQLDRAPSVLEKDVWVCWVLRTLFTMPDRLPMVFKGGTSLSKVFGAIMRFSEDVDITLDYRGLDGSFDPSTFVRDHVHGVVAPHFQNTLDAELDADAFQLELSDDGETLRVHYPTVLETPGAHLGNSVLVEFGRRNITEPNDDHEIQPDIAEHIAELEFPHSTVSVLSPARTFWEKATLIHVECQREFRAGAARLSRHWYDLAMLADQAQGRAAMANRALLADVVKHKKIFYSASYANYDACLAGRLKLIPESTALAALRDDFERMISAGMFIGEPPMFDAVIERLRALEMRINERVRHP